MAKPGRWIGAKVRLFCTGKTAQKMGVMQILTGSGLKNRPAIFKISMPVKITE
jgi:hypothetical protein